MIQGSKYLLTPTLRLSENSEIRTQFGDCYSINRFYQPIRIYFSSHRWVFGQSHIIISVSAKDSQRPPTMKIISPSFEIYQTLNPDAILKSIESCGRVCYKSEHKATCTSSSAFIKRIIKSGHESVLEHEKITVKITCDRGVSHEIVRHRIASYSQESTRYCNYSKDRFGRELTFIKPCFWEETSPEYLQWKQIMETIEDAYNALIESGAKPEEARSILPNSLKTELVVTMNLREWRHFFNLRCAQSAHPQMREIAIPLLECFQYILPAVFGDIQP